MLLLIWYGLLRYAASSTCGDDGTCKSSLSSYEKDVTLMEGERARVNLYDGHYRDHMNAAQTKIRIDTYGPDGDVGQSSWMTVSELNEVVKKLGLTNSSHLLEVGCGSGGASVYIAKAIGCKVSGVDLNPHGVEMGKSLVESSGVADLIDLRVVDASEPLPFGDGIFDAVFSNDVLCHIRGRTRVLSDWQRLLKPGGRIAYTDAMVITGMVSSDEIATRSSIGKYYFLPFGQNEQFIEAANLKVLEVVDTTVQAAQVAKRWHDSRKKHKNVLQEPTGNFDGLQNFLWTVYILLHEKRLSRFMYLATKPKS